MLSTIQTSSESELNTPRHSSSAVVVITGPDAREVALKASNYLDNVKVIDRTHDGRKVDHQALSRLTWSASCGTARDRTIITAPEVNVPPIALPPSAQWVYAAPGTSVAVALLAMQRAEELVR